MPSRGYVCSFPSDREASAPRRTSKLVEIPLCPERKQNKRGNTIGPTSDVEPTLWLTISDIFWVLVALHHNRMAKMGVINSPPALSLLNFLFIQNPSFVYGLSPHRRRQDEVVTRSYFYTRPALCGCGLTLASSPRCLLWHQGLRS